MPNRIVFCLNDCIKVTHHEKDDAKEQREMPKMTEKVPITMHYACFYKVWRIINFLQKKLPRCKGRWSNSEIERFFADF